MSDLRPRLHLEVDMTPDRAFQRVVDQLNAPECPFKGKLLTHQVELSIPEPDHHFWSPQLNIVFSRAPDTTRTVTVLEGRFGPGPEVWTMFMAFYAALIFSGSGLLILASSQWMLGESIWGLWAGLGCFVALGVVHAIAMMGRNMAAEQSHLLKAFILDAIGLEENAS